MRIIEFRAENLKRLTAVTIRPDADVVQVTGKNGQGKTSVLDAIWWALDGARNIQADPIHHGADKALVRLDLGDLVVTRKFRRAGTEPNDAGYTTSVSVESKDGASYKSPQAVIDKLLGSLSFDPLGFARLEPKKQFDAIRGLVPIDWDQIDRLNKADFDARTEINRDLATHRNVLAAAEREVPPADQATEGGETVADAQAAFDEADRENRLSETNAAYLRVREERAAQLTGRVEETKAEIDRLRARLLEDEGVIATLRNEIDFYRGSIKPVTDLRPFGARITAARARAERETITARATATRDRYRVAVDELEAKASRLTASLERRSADVKAAVASADLPVAGLELDDLAGTVSLRGVPFAQASDAEQLRASISIAGAMNPKLRVIRVRDGSLLDDDSMKLLEEYAAAGDLQIWVERVDSSGAVGFVIEDGHLKGAE